QPPTTNHYSVPRGDAFDVVLRLQLLARLGRRQRVEDGVAQVEGAHAVGVNQEAHLGPKDGVGGAGGGLAAFQQLLGGAEQVGPALRRRRGVGQELPPRRVQDHGVGAALDEQHPVPVAAEQGRLQRLWVAFPVCQVRRRRTRRRRRRAAPLLARRRLL